MAIGKMMRNAMNAKQAAKKPTPGASLPSPTLGKGGPMRMATQKMAAAQRQATSPKPAAGPKPALKQAKGIARLFGRGR